MAADNEEENLLRSVALQNASSILAARQRAERQLIETNAVLERKTQELAQANRRLILLNQVATGLIVGTTPQEQLKAAFDAVAQELGAKVYLNYRVDEKDPDALVLATSGGLDAAQQNALHRIAFGQTLCGQVAQSHSLLVVEHVQKPDDKPAAAYRAMGVRTYAGLPLLAHGTLLGTIAFGLTGDTPFTEADIELLKTLADQFAATLDRTRLVERLRENDTRYRAALVTGRMGSWETDFEAGTRTWSEEAMTLFGFKLPGGRGHIGGETDEFRAALHPDDRHLVQKFHQIAQKEDTFAAEYRIVRPDGTTLWLSGRGRVVARGADGKARRMVNIVADVTDRRKAEDHIQLLMREISHRSKNLLAVVQAISGQTARTAGTLEEFEARFSRRLQGLATSHDLLVHESWRGAPLGDLVRDQLAPFAEAGGSRLTLAGPDVFLTTGAAQGMGLALHELATNAIKYGALSSSNGTVTISWAFQDCSGQPRQLRVYWLERGGPPVTPPTHKGFGHIVIESMVAQSVNGEVAMSFDPEGLRWTLTMPITNLVAETRDSALFPPVT